MNKTSDNTTSLGIHYIDVNAKERATFDRVIAFNVTHGLTAHICNDALNADLIIASESAISQIDQSANKTVLVIADQADSSLGDVILTRPLLITRVMKGLETAINTVREKQSQTTDTNIEINQSTDDDQQQTSSAAASSDATSSVENIIVEDIVVEDIIVEDTVIEEKEESTSKHHALVIDDSAAIRKQLELELRDAGITADFAASGEEALEKAEEGEFDLIFLDIIMPGIDGYETCKRMRATEKYKKTPIIMLSGKTSPLDEVQGVIAGATTYLTKPVKSAMLQETLNRVTKWIKNFSETESKKESATA